MRIHDLIEHIGQLEPVTASPNETLTNAAKKLNHHNFGALPVVNFNKNLVGILSERDLVQEIAENGQQLFNKTVNDIMTKTVVTCSFDDLIDDVYHLLIKQRIRHIPIMDGDKLKAMLSIRDFEISYKKLRENSLIDEVTGLPNAKYFQILLDKEFKRFNEFKNAFSLAKIKIDGLETINKTRGYACGDSLIKNCLEILNNELTTHDSCARITYDELAIIMPYTSYSTVCKTLKRILEKFMNSSPLTDIPKDVCRVVISVTHTRSELERSGTLIARADKLLREAAHSGENKLIIDSTMP